MPEEVIIESPDSSVIVEKDDVDEVEVEVKKTNSKVIIEMIDDNVEVTVLKIPVGVIIEKEDFFAEGID